MSFIIYAYLLRSQIKLLSGPPQKKPPTFIKPPGMFGAEDGGVPAAFAQLAAALASSQGIHLCV